MSVLRDSARWLAAQLTAAREPLNALSAPQLGTSSIEAGQIEEYDQAGTLVSVTGEQFDGTHAAVTLAGPVPPEPSAPSVTAAPGQVEVRWNGKFAGDFLSPMDFSHVAVHASRQDIFEPDNTTQRATISGESGDVATVMLDAGEWAVLLVAVSKAGKWSNPSDPVPVEVPDAPGDVLDSIIQLDADFQGVQASVDGKTAITNATVDPAVNGTTTGDHWRRWTTLADGGKLIGSWRWTGSEWLIEALDPTYLPLIDIGAGTFGLLSGGRLVAKSVKADALEALLVLASEIIAGNPDGFHAKMTPSGFKVMAPVDGGAPAEVVSLGSETNDFFAVTSPDGQQVATINADGDIAGQNVSAGQSFTYQGTELQDYLADNPGGIDTSGFNANTGVVGNIASTWMRVIGVQFVAKPGRNYRAVFQGMNVYSTVAGDRVNVKMSYARNVVPSSTTPPADMGITYLPVANTAISTPPLQATGTFNPSTAEEDITVIVWIRRETGSGMIAYNTYAGDANYQKPLRLWIEDVGYDVPETGTSYLEAGSAPPASPAPSKITRTVEYAHNAVRSYQGSGSPYSFDTAKGYQGLSPAGYGNLKSIWNFPSVTSLLSGATVNDIWAYFYFEHWYYGAGGTARIMVHGNSTSPSTYAGQITFAVSSSSWPRGAGRWVRIPSSLYDGFKSGTYKGFALEGDGTYGTYGIANAARIRIKYTK